MQYFTIEEAEKIAGDRLDRRYKWFLWDGEVCYDGKFTRPCSGCSCGCEYGCSCCNERGAGCVECGYTGKRRDSFPIPYYVEKARRAA